MGRGPNTFRQRDVSRAYRAARKAGADVARIEIDKDGKIIVVIGDRDTAATVNSSDSAALAAWRDKIRKEGLK